MIHAASGARLQAVMVDWGERTGGTTPCQRAPDRQPRLNELAIPAAAAADCIGLCAVPRFKLRPSSSSKAAAGGGPHAPEGMQGAGPCLQYSKAAGCSEGRQDSHEPACACSTTCSSTKQGRRQHGGSVLWLDAAAACAAPLKSWAGGSGIANQEGNTAVQRGSISLIQLSNLAAIQGKILLPLLLLRPTGFMPDSLRWQELPPASAFLLLLLPLGLQKTGHEATHPAWTALSSPWVAPWAEPSCCITWPGALEVVGGAGLAAGLPGDTLLSHCWTYALGSLWLHAGVPCQEGQDSRRADAAAVLCLGQARQQISPMGRHAATHAGKLRCGVPPCQCRLPRAAAARLVAGAARARLCQVGPLWSRMGCLAAIDQSRPEQELIAL